MWIPAAVIAMSGAPSFAALFQGGAVLQRDTEAAVWGAGAGGGPVALYVNGAHAADAAVKAGNWSARLPAHGVAFGAVLTAGGTDGNTSVTVQYGDVVLCSGTAPPSPAPEPHTATYRSRCQVSQTWTCRL
jgi:hypothetical protein